MMETPRRENDPSDPTPTQTIFPSSVPSSAPVSIPTSSSDHPPSSRGVAVERKETEEPRPSPRGRPPSRRVTTPVATESGYTRARPCTRPRDWPRGIVVTENSSAPVRRTPGIARSYVPSHYSSSADNSPCVTIVASSHSTIRIIHDDDDGLPEEQQQRVDAAHQERAHHNDGEPQVKQARLHRRLDDHAEHARERRRE